ncbi:MAG: UDP-glucose/GDP-mannose dehydrogenase family protein [Acidimicrobiales bacterium]|nr:UDP-glucose/GDP-mannose dehydrogenase family protein [Acidimicrobiales bacterium]
MRIVIVGAGVVGTATGKGFARRGHAVAFVDTDVRRVDALRGEGAAASTELDLSGPAATVMLSVPTPSTPDGGYDLSAVRGAAASVGEALRGAEDLTTVVLRCTVAPGTLEGTLQPIVEQRSSLKAGEGFALASNPEFLRAECALEDFLAPWMTVVASRSKRTRERLAELYRPFGGSLQVFADPAEAEFVKLVHNVFNATKISFFNEVWSMASHLGLDAERIAATVAQSAEASWNPAYGIRGGRPYGGACLPKDVSGFLGFARELGLAAPMAAATRAVNDRLAREADQPTIDLRTPIGPEPGPAGVPRR